MEKMSQLPDDEVDKMFASMTDGDRLTVMSAEDQEVSLADHYDHLVNQGYTAEEIDTEFDLRKDPKTGVVQELVRMEEPE